MGDTTVDMRMEKLSEAKRALLEKRLGAAVQRLQAPAAAVTTPALLEAEAQAEDIPFALTPIQQAYLVGRHAEMELGSIGCQSYSEVDVEALDCERFERALQRIIARHGMLRAVVVDGRQKVLSYDGTRLVQVEDLRGYSHEIAAAKLLEIREAMARRRFDVHRWPLFEFRISLLPDGRARVHFVIDVMMIDGSSLRIITSELWRVYRDPAVVLSPIAISFSTYLLGALAAREGSERQRSRDYWLARLDSIPPPPALPLTAAHADTLTDPKFTRRAARLGAAQWESVRRCASRAGIPVTPLVLAAFAEVLGRWSNSDTFNVNLTVYDRQPVHPDVPKLVGNFTAVVLLMVDRSLWSDFFSGARRVHEQLWQDLDHIAFSGVEVARELRRRAGGEGGLVKAPIVFTSVIGTSRADDWVEDELTPVFGISQTPQVLLDCQVIEGGHGLVFQWDSVDAVFPPGLLDSMFDAFQRLLEWLASDPDESAVLPELVPEAELQFRAELNAGCEAPPRLLHAGFAESARARATAIAVATNERDVDYDTLRCQANRVSRSLREGGLRRGDLVGILLDKSVAQIAAVLGVLRAGAAYLPLAPDLPDERIRQILRVSGARFVLGWHRDCDRIGAIEAAQFIGVDDLQGVDPGDPEPVASPDDLAYVIFTSGSTGVPKGVMIRHRAAANTIRDMNARFGVGREDRVLSLSSLSFDLSVYDVFGIFLAGGTIVLPDAEHRRDPSQWLALCSRARVTLWNTVPALFQMFVDYLETSHIPGPAALRLAWLSGDWIPTGLPEAARRCVPGLTVISLGGATEASIWSVFYPIGRVDPSWRSIPYGKPLENQSLHVLDARFRPCPTLVRGDLYIGGAGVADGYLNDPERTAASFVTHPDTGERLYRTGDVAAYLPDGNLEFLGRLDGQVKIRGHRIELGEIEHCLAAHEGVSRCVAVAIGERERRRLIAYVVPRTAVDPELAEALRAHVRGRLPEYMVPEQVVLLDTLPISANGKVDVKALPAPHLPRVQEDATAPRAHTFVLEVLMNLASGLLPGVPVDARTDLFLVGGSSLDAVRLVGRANEVFGLRLPLRPFLANPTVGNLAEMVERGRGLPTHVDRPEPTASRASEFPLSSAQESMWLLQRLEPASVAYHTIDGFRVSGPLDYAELIASFGELVQRHSALRTVFCEREEGLPVQRVLADAAPELEFRDLRAESSDVQSELLPEITRELAYRPYDIQRRPPVRFALVRLTETEHILLVAMHHIICDAWSISLLLRDLWTFYDARTRGVSPRLSELPYAYGELVQWRVEHLAASPERIALWQRKLENTAFSVELPRLPRRDGPYGVGERFYFLLPARTHAALVQLARDTESTLYVVALTMFAAVLGRISGQEDFVIGTPVADRFHTAAEEVVGLFVNTLPMRVSVSGRPSMKELVARTRKTVLEAMDLSDVPFEHIVRAVRPARVPGQNPLFNVMFALQNAPALPVPASGLLIETLALEPATAKFELTLELKATAEGLVGFVEYRPEVLAKETVQVVIRCFERLAAHVVEQPGEPVETLLTDPVTPTVDDSGAAAPAGGLAQYFLASAHARPAAAAVITPERTWSYCEVACRARQVARALQARGLGSESLVGVIGERSVDTIVALLGVLLAGAAYVPFDASQLTARSVAAAASLGVELMLSTVDVHAGPTWSAPTVALSELLRWPEDAYRPSTVGESLAYVLFTSGSTGTPRAVGVSHRAICSRIEWALAQRCSRSSDRTLMSTSITFDVSIVEIFETFASGGALVTGAGLGRWPASHRVQTMAEHGVTILNAVPSLLRALLGEPGFSALSSLRRIHCGAEALTPELRDELLAAHPRVELHNFYGATEASVDSTVARCSIQDGPTVNVGKPLTNARVYVLDDRLRALPRGIPGEIYLAGGGLARAYCGQQVKTAERFVPCPFTTAPGQRMYRTGDRGRILSDGSLELLGRRDDQIKVAGVRIELSEVRSVLSQHRAVSDAHVFTELGSDGEVKLCAAVAASALTARELRQFLRTRLPSAFVPVNLVVLATLPRTRSGKVDVPALREISRNTPETAPVSAADPRTHEELIVMQVFEELLETTGARVEDDFFDLGGHSLLALSLVKRLTERFRVQLSTADVLEHSTVESLAALIRSGGSDVRSPTRVRLRAGSAAPLFMVHPIGGDVVCYRSVARALRTRRAVVGLASPYLRDGVPEHASVAELAAAHSSQVLEEQPHGTYVLAGWSFGGVVAHEMVLSLARRGKSVSRLILIDARLPDGSEVGQRELNEFANDLAAQRGLAEPCPASDLRSILSWLIERNVLPAYSDESGFARAFEAYQAHSRAFAVHELSRIDVPIDFLRPRVGDEPSIQRALARWCASTSGELRIHAFDGDHYSIARAHQYQRVATIIDELL
jgi:amino acid adenylation domain-containing protein